MTDLQLGNRILVPQWNNQNVIYIYLYYLCPAQKHLVVKREGHHRFPEQPWETEGQVQVVAL